MSADYDLGMLTLCANAYWKAATWPRRIAAVLLGQHQVFEHLGTRMRISFYQETPYLITIKEVA